MKSSLKTFLKGENPICGIKIVGTDYLSLAVDSREDVNGEVQYHLNDGSFWHVDVLDDGTAITYCSDVG